MSETFRRHTDAQSLALETERRIDRGEMPLSWATFDPTTFGHLVDLHLADTKEVGKAPRRSKAFSIDALKAKLGNVKLKDLDRERPIKCTRSARDAAGRSEPDGRCAKGGEHPPGDLGQTAVCVHNHGVTVEPPAPGDEQTAAGRLQER